MRFLSYFHDPDDLFIPLLETIDIPEELNCSIVAVTPETTIQIYELVKGLGFKTIEGCPYGFGRIAALKESLKNGSANYSFVCDFDKMLHWPKTNRKEFLEIINSKYDSDLSVIARGPKALKTYPKAWLETENIASKIMQKLLGKKVDLMNGPYILSRKAAELISNGSIEFGVGSCAKWCILAKQANSKIDNIEVEGLTWEDPDRYQDAINKYGSYEEWRKRVEFLHKQVEVMIRLAEESINPKYPYVKNKTFKQ